MRLSDEEKAMLHGEHGEARKWAMQHLLKVGQFFDAADLVPVSQAHMMADTESLGEAGVELLERLASLPRDDCRVRVPMITDPRGTDLRRYQRLGQSERMAELERRAIKACEAMGILMTDTCINYQTIMPPGRGEHLAFGDTGVVFYCNSVLGAYSNYEGGPSALAAGLTGRAPRYGLHLPENRRATNRFVLRHQPRGLSEWGVLGAIVGKRSGSYWNVPVIEGVEVVPGSDELKHMGAAMASFGSIPLFHIVGLTPEAPTLDAVTAGTPPPAEEITKADFEAVFDTYGRGDGKVDVVVFAAPQLSLIEMRRVADLLEGRAVNDGTALLVCTSPSVAADCRRAGIVERIEASGAMVLEGMCFYNSYAREVGEMNGWKRLMTNSTKLVNIIGGYGYEPTLASMEDCVEAAVTERAA